MTDSMLYPKIEPYEEGFLDVGDGHRLAYELSGNPQGRPLVFLHGGPGSGCKAEHRRFFDPKVYRIVLFDQRGSGRSTPTGSIESNTTHDLIADMETLRALLQIERWIIFGGSWGSTLALAYAARFPERCVAMILRGIFLARSIDNDWFMHEVRGVFPDLWEAFVAQVGEDHQSDLLAAYYDRLFSDDPLINRPAAQAWANFESQRTTLFPNSRVEEEWSEQTLWKARINIHYIRSLAFLADGELLENIDRFRHVPGIIIHGRYDMVCQIEGAFALAKAWPEAQFQVVPAAGHSAFEPGICELLVKATDHFRELAF